MDRCFLVVVVGAFCFFLGKNDFNAVTACSVKNTVIDDTCIYIYFFLLFFCAAHQLCNIYVHMCINMCVFFFLPVVVVVVL